MNVLSEFSFRDAIDVVLVAALLYALLRGLRNVRSALVMSGVAIASMAYFAVRVLNLKLVSFIFQSFFTVLLVALVVLFQEELRDLFESLALRLWRRLDVRQAPVRPARRDLDVLADTLAEFARERIGALVVLQGKGVLTRHVQGGIPLYGLLSEGLLKSIFDPHSAGHDGAVLVARGRVTAFACHLPLSSNQEELAGRGTRHAAALGLSERSDALCLVVSEERGTITVASAGRLEPLPDAAALRRRLEEFSASRQPEPARYVAGVFTRRLPLKALALALALLFWLFFVYGSAVEYRSYRVPVHYTGVPPNLEVTEVRPGSCQVIVSAARRDFLLRRPGDPRLTLKLFDCQIGSQEVQLTASDVTLPDPLTFVNIAPRSAVLEIAPKK